MVRKVMTRIILKNTLSFQIRQKVILSNLEWEDLKSKVCFLSILKQECPSKLQKIFLVPCFTLISMQKIRI